MSINVDDINQLTRKINSFNQSIDSVIANGLTQLANIPDTVLRSQKIQEFFDGQVSPKVQEQIGYVKGYAVGYLHGQYTNAMTSISFLEPIVNANFSDLGSVIGWARNVIRYFTGPYGEAVATITETVTAVTNLAQALQNTQQRLMNYTNYLDPQILQTLGSVALPSISLPSMTITMAEVISGEVNAS